MAITRLEIDLPVCPLCKSVSPMAQPNGKVQFFCTGAMISHRRVKMEKRPFREVKR
jgi:hypothetical protein